MKRKHLLLIFILLCLFTFTGCSESKKSNKLEEGTDYFVKGEFTGQYLDLKKRGYYIDTLNQPNAPYYYIICMGEKNTGGYSLKLKEVNKIDGKTEIIVEETSPGKEDIVTMAFTYPTLVVEFPNSQDNIVIKNTKDEVFDLLK
jgi:hypothetical protein